MVYCRTEANISQVIFFVPETAYRREINTDRASTENLLYPPPHKEKPPFQAGAAGQRSTFTQRLALFNGRKTDENPIELLLRPFALLIHPAIIWGMITQGAMIGWTVMIGVVLGIAFMGPPLWFNEMKTGYVYTGAFVGAALGFVLSGLFSDWSARLLSRRNAGVYEPEFRILLVVPQSLIGVIGIFGFGLATDNVGKYGVYLASFFFGMEVMGMVLGATASALYLVDAHRDIAIESFTCLLLFKNFFSFGLTWKAVDWVGQLGVWKLFWIIGVVQIAVCLLSLPMCMFSLFLSPSPSPSPCVSCG